MRALSYATAHLERNAEPGPLAALYQQVYLFSLPSALLRRALLYSSQLPARTKRPPVPEQVYFRPMPTSAYLAVAAFALFACSQQPPESGTASAARPPAKATNAQPPAPTPFPETFEAGSKGAYEEADEPLATGSWHFQDALIGNSPQDHKTGEQAARLRGLGRIRMNFDAGAGVRRISISAAAYGTDGPSTWELWLSRDGGRTYARTGGPGYHQRPGAGAPRVRGRGLATHPPGNPQNQRPQNPAGHR
jgi:hypothetical protein